MIAKNVQHDLYAELIDQLITVRKSLGYSQLEADERIGCTEGLVAKWETGQRRPTPLYFAMWCKSLGVRLEIVPDE